MPLRRTGVLVGLSVALCASLLAGSASATYDGGLSTPQEDSYYPAHGDPGIDVLHYGLDLDWHRGSRTLRGVADLNLRATGDAGSFQLDLGRTLRVQRVTVDGEPVDSTHGNEVLTVLAPVVADERYDVRVVYRGTPERVRPPTTRSDAHDHGGMAVTANGQLRTMQEPFGAFTWYPVNDQPSDKALYDIRVEAPRHWVGVSNGTLVGRHRADGRTVTRFHLEHPAASYLVTLAVGPYELHRGTGPHGLPLSFWLPRGNADRYLPTLRHVPADLRWLESKLGPYPFESAGVVIVPGGSAMETQTLVTFGDKGWDNARYAREVMVHELAHQWYGDTVTPSDWRDPWLNEGMAMYLQARWSASHRRSWWPAWIAEFSDSNIYDREAEGGPGAYDRRMFATNCVYYCTAAMYEQLRKDVGGEAFWRLVKEWPQTHLDQNADRSDFEELAEAITGRDLTTFFDEWLNSPVWPPA